MPDDFAAILTSRLRLRCVEERDAESLCDLMTAGVSRWLASWTSPFPREAALALIARARSAAAQGRALPMVIERLDDGALLGWIALNTQSGAAARGAFGFWLAEAFQGKGYMREAAPVALAAGFEKLRLDLVEAAAQIGNAPARGILEACGMRHVTDTPVPAPARSRDELCAVYQLTAAEWTARTASS